MKRIVLQYTLMLYTIAYAGPPLGESLGVTNTIQSSLLAEWGLQYCLQYDKENLFKSIVKDEPFALRKDVAQGKLDLQKYLDNEYLGNAINTHRFKYCMIIYRSEAYQDEVKRIVRKYCKECK